MNTPHDTTTALLGELRAVGHSWYRIARLLDVHDQTIDNLRKGGRMSDATAVRACAALGKSPRQTAATLAALSADRAPDDATRAAWRDALKRLGGIAATVALLIGGNGPTPPAARAGSVGEEVAGSVYYVKRRRRRAGFADILRRILLVPLVT